MGPCFRIKAAQKRLALRVAVYDTIRVINEYLNHGVSIVS